ncbi:MAG: hypothetical protein ACI9BC_001505, partial [Crocinitomicaceae bacterium]
SIFALLGPLGTGLAIGGARRVVLNNHLTQY